MEADTYEFVTIGTEKNRGTAPPVVVEFAGVGTVQSILEFLPEICTKAGYGSTTAGNRIAGRPGIQYACGCSLWPGWR